MFHTKYLRELLLVGVYTLGVLGIVASGGGGGGGGGGGSGDDENGGTTPFIPTPIFAFELRDPDPSGGAWFGHRVVLLSNGNLVVLDPWDSTVAVTGGAVHLFDPAIETPIASFYGNDTSDFQPGTTTITALPNGNFVFNAPGDDVGGISGAGSVRLINGTTGVQIGSTVSGDTTSDVLGELFGPTVLSNGNYVIVSPADDEGGVVDAGSIRLFDGDTGTQIGSTIAGDDDNDLLGFGGVTPLANGNFVVASPQDDESGVVDAGSVRLISGTTGLQIGTAIVGETSNDFSNVAPYSVTALSNSNYIIVALFDDEGGVVDAGSARLVNGATGTQIGSTIAGDVTLDFSQTMMDFAGITPLANSNFVLSLPFDDEGGIIDAGTVRLIDGGTGAQIGTTITGDFASDQLSSTGVTILANDNYVVSSDSDDEGGIIDAGSVRLYNGSTGTEIGSGIIGDATGDRVGLGEILALANDNFVSVSFEDDQGGISGSGAVRLVNGTTGVQIGNTIAGDDVDDRIGFQGIFGLPNSNFVVASNQDDDGGVVDAGTVGLYDGTTAVQIGSTIAGDNPGDLGGETTVIVLPNGNFVIVSEDDDEGGIVNAGSVRLINGANGVQIGSTLAGDVTNDQLGSDRVIALSNSNFVVVSDRDDEKGIVDAGSARLVSGTTGIPIGDAVTGNNTDDFESDSERNIIVGPASGGEYFLSLSRADNGGLVDSGQVGRIAP